MHIKLCFVADMVGYNNKIIVIDIHKCRSTLTKFKTNLKNNFVICIY